MSLLQCHQRQTLHQTVVGLWSLLRGRAVFTCAIVLCALCCYGQNTTVFANAFHLQQFWLVVQKLNQIDDKLDNFSRKVNMLFCKGRQPGTDEHPLCAIRSALIILADTMKELNTCGMAVQDECVRHKWVCFFVSLVLHCVLLLCADRFHYMIV